MYTAAAEELVLRLQDAGLRATNQRRAIVEALIATPEHITAEDLTEAVKRAHPDVHPATVYRTLEALEAVEAIYRLDVGHGPTQWHLAEGPHQHLVCDSCGRVEEISSPAFARLATALAKEHGFRADLRHIAVQGRCERCGA